MPSIIKKQKNGKAYYYAVQCKRVKGKPRIVWQKYLGSVEAIIKQCEQNLAPAPTETVLFEAGGVAALLSIATRLGLIDLINEIVPKREQGPSVGHYIVLAALNRVLDPESKSQIGDWYHNTSLQRLWGFSSDLFSSQSYWNHMDTISDDAIEKIQNFLAKRVREDFTIDTQPLLYDTTNFFTYIDSHNERNTIAKRGKNKQKRSNLRQVSLALLTTREFQIPLLHKTYDGDCPDVKFFPDIVRDLLQRHAAIYGNQDSTLVFDKGNLSEETREKLLYSGIYFVAGIKAEVLPKVFTTPLDQFQEALKMPGTKFYETTVELDGKSCKAVASYSESFFTEQLAAVTATMTKCQNQLKDLQNSLLSWSSEKKTKGPRPTAAKIKERLKQILSPQHMEKVFSINLSESDGIFNLRYSVNREGLEDLTATRLGRTLLITNRLSWLPTEVISCYRDLANIEETFKLMKNREYLRWQPAFHWTDQKIKVHSLYCVLALLLATLARKMAWEADVELSLPKLLDDLSGIKEVALLYSASKKGKQKTQFTMSRMSPRQKKLAELFEIGDVLARGSSSSAA
jgi:transposase